MKLRKKISLIDQHDKFGMWEENLEVILYQKHLKNQLRIRDFIQQIKE